MATTYEVINVRKWTKDGKEQRLVYCFSDAENDNLICGTNTESLYMTLDDFNYTLRSKGYTITELYGARITPIFNRQGMMVDFELDRSTAYKTEVV